MVEATERRVHQEFGAAYTIIPGPRNQDVVRIIPSKGDLKFAACVVDGWNNREFIPGNDTGRKVANFVAERFPQIFQETKFTNFKKRAVSACQAMDSEVLDCWPAHASCVGSFLFSFEQKDVLVTVGSVVVFVWDGKGWLRPKTIGDYSLDPQKYPSDVSRFFGRGELKNNHFYSCEPDVTIYSPGKPVFIASDGLENFVIPRYQGPEAFIAKLIAEIKSRKNFQKDDISLLLKSKQQ